MKFNRPLEGLWLWYQHLTFAPKETCIKSTCKYYWSHGYYFYMGIKLQSEKSCFIPIIFLKISDLPTVIKSIILGKGNWIFLKDLSYPSPCSSYIEFSFIHSVTLLPYTQAKVKSCFTCFTKNIQLHKNKLQAITFFLLHFVVKHYDRLCYTKTFL